MPDLFDFQLPPVWRKHISLTGARQRQQTDRKPNPRNARWEAAQHVSTCPIGREEKPRGTPGRRVLALTKRAMPARRRSPNTPTRGTHGPAATPDHPRFPANKVFAVRAMIDPTTAE
jgi:hypothetical protein